MAPWNKTILWSHRDASTSGRIDNAGGTKNERHASSTWRTSCLQVAVAFWLRAPFSTPVFLRARRSAALFQPTGRGAYKSLHVPAGPFWQWPGGRRRPAAAVGPSTSFLPLSIRHSWHRVCLARARPSSLCGVALMETTFRRSRIGADGDGARDSLNGDVDEGASRRGTWPACRAAPKPRSTSGGNRLDVRNRSSVWPSPSTIDRIIVGRRLENFRTWTVGRGNDISHRSIRDVDLSAIDCHGM